MGLSMPFCIELNCIVNKKWIKGYSNRNEMMQLCWAGIYMSRSLRSCVFLMLKHNHALIFISIKCYMRAKFLIVKLPEGNIDCLMCSGDNDPDSGLRDNGINAE